MCYHWVIIIYGNPLERVQALLIEKPIAGVSQGLYQRVTIIGSHKKCDDHDNELKHASCI
jgi:hypothetical protein